jgi:myo-inositol 2-dehydrogenase/D-chiro-inositol 1-dehydrogenase
MLNIGIVGTGWFGLKHAGILAQTEGVKVVAFCGTSREKAARAALPFADAKGYGSISEMLDGTKLDAVYVCVPPHMHGDIELALVERGIPFLVEKPLAADLETPSRILEAVKARKLLTSVGYHFRYMESVARAKALLADSVPGMALGFGIGSMPAAAWFRRQESSGGQFVEQTTHLVDLLRYLLGEVTEVYAAYAQRGSYEREDDVTIADVGSVTMKLAGGAVATLSNSCMLPAGHRFGLHVYTNQGVLEVEPGALKQIEADRTTEYMSRNDPYIAETQTFLYAVRTGDASGILSDYADAWRTQRITTAANLSAQTGQPVSLS